MNVFLESLIIISVFLGMRFFEEKFEWRGYSCPSYCDISHNHIVEGRVYVSNTTERREPRGEQTKPTRPHGGEIAGR